MTATVQLKRAPLAQEEPRDISIGVECEPTPTVREAGGLASLVAGASAGNRKSWDALVDRLAPVVWAVARAHRLSTDDAADVSQITWMRLVENLGQIQQPERVGAWLATTARRESLRLLRLSGRQVPSGADFEVVADPDASERMELGLLDSDRDQAVSRLVVQLPVRSQVLLRLLYAEPALSYKEISEILDIPVGSIGPTRARLLDQLRRLARQARLSSDDLVV